MQHTRFLLLLLLTMNSAQAKIWDAKKASCLKTKYQYLLTEENTIEQWEGVKVSEILESTDFDERQRFSDSIIKKYCQADNKHCEGSVDAKIYGNEYHVREVNCYNRNYFPYKATGKLKFCSYTTFDWDIIHNGEPRTEKIYGICINRLKRKNYDLEYSTLNRHFHLQLSLDTDNYGVGDPELIKLLRELEGQEITVEFREIFKEHPVATKDMYEISGRYESLRVKDESGKIRYEFF